MIEIHSLDKTFDKDSATPVHAVNHLSLSFQEGITGLVGENGAGKSTLFRLIAGTIQKDEGQILIDGSLNDTPKARQSLFFLPDVPYAPARYTAFQTAEFYSLFYPVDFPLFQQLTKKVNLPLERKISTYSKGMRRQLFLLIAFSVQCQNLLLDEAFDGLDPLVMELIREEVVRLAIDQKKTIVISSHNIDSIQRIADSLTILYRGQLSEQNNLSDMSEELVKYQLISAQEIRAEDLEKLGYRIASCHTSGSIVSLIVVKKEGFEEDIKQLYSPTLFEKVPLEGSELVTAEMMLARKGARHE
ncbi:MAG: ABC transporter ATP-binding protein [Erysipelotrichaceae bacterium]|nr:ABC transporter ATP-binding protein [Erysipelotrichaceae bacterium]